LNRGTMLVCRGSGRQLAGMDLATVRGVETMAKLPKTLSEVATRLGTVPGLEVATLSNAEIVYLLQYGWRQYVVDRLSAGTPADSVRERLPISIARANRSPLLKD
jgi:hypothetical protein